MTARTFLTWIGNGFSFHRAAPKWVMPQGPGKEHDDWRVGDLAQCVGDVSWQHLENGTACDGPTAGQVLRVNEVTMREGWHCLGFEGWPDWWVAENFLKIRPNNREACKPAFAEQMKRLRPTVDA